MTCKDCIHYAACQMHIEHSIYNCPANCDCFKNAAYIIELPPEELKTVGEQLGKLLSYIVDVLPDVVNELMTDSEFIKNGIAEAFKE